MTTPTENGGSELHQTPQTERPFNHPLSAYGDNPKVDKDGNPEADSYVDPRMAVMDAVADRANEDREIPEGTRQEDMPAGEPVPQSNEEPDPEGLASKEQFGENAPDPDALPQEYADDPLAEFIEMSGDDPMFRMKVDGRTKLIPLNDARAELQKRVAGNDRLRAASEAEKQLETEREALHAERLAMNSQSVHNPDSEQAQPPTQGAEQDDEQLAERAREVVTGLFTGTEDEAAAKLVELLKENRGAQATPVDPEAIATQAAAKVVSQMTADERKTDIEEGFAQFQSEYPEIEGDEDLFAMADGLVPGIQREHPEWKPSEVMLEAGKRVSKRVGLSANETPEPSNNTPASEDKQRQERKKNLRPMPSSRQGVQETEPEEQEPSPADLINEIRASRGQDV